MLRIQDQYDVMRYDQAVSTSLFSSNHQTSLNMKGLEVKEKSTVFVVIRDNKIEDEDADEDGMTRTFP